MTKPLSEAHIQATCTAWLELDGWRAVETDPKHLRGLGVSEPGMADRLYIRYEGWCFGCKSLCKKSWLGSERGFGVCEPEPHIAAQAVVLFIEWKKKASKAAQHQTEWHAKERARGALTLIAGEDFPASIEGFAKWYQASGLQRKSISIPRA